LPTLGLSPPATVGIETLIRRHYPAASRWWNWSLFVKRRSQDEDKSTQ
jgi:hypothetical protein